MSAKQLVHAVLKMSARLVGAIATSDGRRAPLGDLSLRVPYYVGTELANRGVPQKVIADMLSMSLRTYQARVRAVLPPTPDSISDRIVSLLREHGAMTKDELLAELAPRDESLVRSSLRDAVAHGQARKIEWRGIVRYEVVDGVTGQRESQSDEVEWLLRFMLYRLGRASASTIAAETGMSEAQARLTLNDLTRRGQVRVIEDEPLSYAIDGDVAKPIQNDMGWEASAFHHFAAVVDAMVHKLDTVGRRTQRADTTGGSTYTYDIWEGHPLEEEVEGLLGRFREIASRLDKEDRKLKSQVDMRPTKRVRLYFGQFVGPSDDAE